MDDGQRNNAMKFTLIVAALGLAVLPLGRRHPPAEVQAQPGGRFTVPPGFRVEQAVKIPGSDPRFSLVNMTFDD
jgi:hypothetical protein